MKVLHPLRLLAVIAAVTITVVIDVHIYLPGAGGP